MNKYQWPYASSISGAKLRSIINDDLEISHAEFAERIGVGRPTVSRWVCGRTVVPIPISVLAKLMVRMKENQNA